MRYLGHGLTGFWVVLATAATGFDSGLAQLLERQAQTLWFELRGPIAAPADIVILAIDETSLAQGEFYQADPEQYAALEPIQSWPWRRAAYSTVIDRLMEAGARTVALDVMFTTPSSYGVADDKQLAQTLARYGERVVLAAQYSEVETPQGRITQLSQPIPTLRPALGSIGSINFYLEPDGRIHRLGQQFMAALMRNSPLQAEAFRQLAGSTPTFAAATLRAAQIAYPTTGGSGILFYGPDRTFDHVPFWHALDDSIWESYLQSGDYFRDKIVLIGSTAAVHQDFHAAPFSQTWLYPQPMAGVEIHANAIATLLQNRTLLEVPPSAPWRGLMVAVGLTLSGWLLSRPRQPVRRWLWASGLAIAWLSAGYMALVLAGWMVPAAVPAGAIALCGFSQLLTGAANEQRRKQQLRNTLKQYATSPIVQEILSQQDDLHDLLQERELALSGKILSSRYRIVQVLGAGGFSETYIAEDLLRPGHPRCVVKQLRLVSDNPNTLKLARRLFTTEAETLERLGQHDQIPQLMACFEEDNEFYLVQEFVAGHSLDQELLPQRSLTEVRVTAILYDLLAVVQFIHGQGVIHRDLKPSNIIRRKLDGKLSVIDFGIAKKISTRLIELERNTKFTVGIGTPGYMPPEQAAGRPHFNSDLYALGMIAIEAITGQLPHQLRHNSQTGEVLWQTPELQISPELTTVLTKLVHHDFTQRYQTAEEVQQAIEQLPHMAEVMTIQIKGYGEASPEDDDWDGPVDLAKATQDTVDLPESWPENWPEN